MKQTNESIYRDYLNATDEAEKEEIKNLFYIKNEKFIFHIVKSYKEAKIPYEEILGCAVEGFVKAFNTFNPDNSKFTTYAGRVILNEVNNELRRIDHKKNIVSIETPVNSEVVGVTLEDCLADIKSDYVTATEREDLLNNIVIIAKKCLTYNEYIIFKNMYSDEPVSQYVIAERLGVTQTAVSRSTKKALMKILKELEEKGYTNDI